MKLSNYLESELKLLLIQKIRAATSQQQVATVLGVGKGRVSQIMRQPEKPIKLATLVDYLDKLGVPVGATISKLAKERGKSTA